MEKVQRKIYFLKAEVKEGISDIRLTEGEGFAFYNKKELESIKVFPIDRKVLEEYFKVVV